MVWVEALLPFENGDLLSTIHQVGMVEKTVSKHPCPLINCHLLIKIWNRFSLTLLNCGRFYIVYHIMVFLLVIVGFPDISLIIHICRNIQNKGHISRLMCPYVLQDCLHLWGNCVYHHDLDFLMCLLFRFYIDFQKHFTFDITRFYIVCIWSHGWEKQL